MTQGGAIKLSRTTQDAATPGGREYRGNLSENGRVAMEAKAVSARYETSSELALHRVSLSLARGEILSVLGPNGAGKTTLLRVLAGVVAPSAGEVTSFGAPLATMTRSDVAKKIAVVRQAEPTTFGFSVRDVVMMGRAPHQGGWMRPTNEDERIVDDAIARLDLAEIASRPVRELSGGEARRVAIARAFAQTPEVLLLDEPGAFLDVRHQIALYERLATEVGENDLACLVVMHDLHMAAQYSHRVALLDAGKLVAIGSPTEVLTEPRVREVFGVDLATGIDARSNARYFVPVRARDAEPHT